VGSAAVGSVSVATAVAESEWGQSDTRKALLNLMVVVGPIFGNHYRREPPEIPSVSAPAADDDDDRPVRIGPPGPDE
jgi:hypothetical protein